MSKTASYYKSLALWGILNERTHTRGFDNCFENGYGDEVVKYLIAKLDEKLEELPVFDDVFDMMHDPNFEKEYRAYCRLENKHCVQEALNKYFAKNPKVLNRWRYFVENGTYDGYKD